MVNFPNKGPKPLILTSVTFITMDCKIPITIYSIDDFI